MWRRFIDALGEGMYRKRLGKFAGGICLPSYPICVSIARMISVGLLDKEGRNIYKRKGENSREAAVCEEREHTPNEWQPSWQNESRTGRLIGNLGSWQNRKYGKIVFSSSF